MYFAIVRRAVTGCGRNQNETYVNVVWEVRNGGNRPFSELLSHPVFSNPASNEFAIELDEATYNSLAAFGGIFHDGNANLPRWQQRVATNGATLELGSWSNPESAASTWGTAQVLDDRLIVRLYNGDPGSGGTHIAAEDIDEAPGSVTRHLKLFTAAGVASGTNAQNAKTLIAGKQMIFDFTVGVSTVLVATSVPGVIEFPSNHAYRVVGPGGEKQVTWTIYGRTLTVQ